MEQLIIKLSVLLLIVIGIMYMAISFLPLFVLRDTDKDNQKDKY
ncbi:hypothetical protein [Aceticella autotrophica]|jgi:hypothetical protein|nr:hypothetical protein [Aceticella autotrophica]